MCGITGVAGYENIVRAMLQSIRNLEYRGYDSCGVALITDGALKVRKDTGTVDEVIAREHLFELSGYMGIAHTRWATHGAVTRANAHPQCSRDGTFAVVHNGVISNYQDLRELLQQEEFTFESQTDTEVIPHMVEKFYAETHNVEEAFVRTLQSLEGTYAVAMVAAREPEKIFCAKKESPLIIGTADRVNYIGSDFNAFIPYTKNAVILDDAEYAVVTRDGYVVRDVFSGQFRQKTITRIDWDPEVAQKGGYPHYMLKEIHEQPGVVQNALTIGRDQLRTFAELLAHRQRHYLIGVGTTYYVGQVAQYLLASLARRFVPALAADEFLNLAEVDADTLVLAISQSGETYDILSVLPRVKEEGATVGAVVNVAGSSVARAADHVIMQGAGPEICVVSTKAALSQMVILLRIILELALLDGTMKPAQVKKQERALSELPHAIQHIINERSGLIHRLAHQYCHTEHWLYLGRGIYYPIAMESALKMKEVSYLHAEGMPGGFLKHGTLSLISPSFCSVIFLPSVREEKVYELTLCSAEEVKARGGFLIGFRFEDNKFSPGLFDEEIVLPDMPELIGPFAQLVVAQLFAYFTATALRRDVDKPRALAKSVTVP